MRLARIGEQRPEYISDRVGNALVRVSVVFRDTAEESGPLTESVK